MKRLGFENESSSDLPPILSPYSFTPKQENCVNDPKEELMRLLPGDIFHASCPNGASLICLVEAITDGRIEARRITSQDHWTFERGTGHTKGDTPELRCTIDSIAPVPVDIHNILLGLDRKMRLRFEKLSREEKDALLFVARFYPDHPL